MNYGTQLNYKTLIYVNGVFIAFLSVTMLIPMLVDWSSGHTNYKNFLISSLGSGFISGIIIIAAKPDEKLNLHLKEAFCLIPVCWIIISCFSSIPLIIGGIPITDAFFEVISSITTTGATVFPKKIDTLSSGIHLWCAILQWFGGIGIIVMAMSIMPVLRIGGMQLLRMESSDHRSEKLLPRVSQVASSIFGIYVFFTILAMILLSSAGMGFFDAICHSMGALSTGGVSTTDTSISYYNSFSIELIMATFMLIGGTPLFFFLKLWKGDWSVLWKDRQVKTYYFLIFASVLSVTFWLWNTRGFDFLLALRYSLFNTISVATSSGYTSTEYTTWGGFPVLILLFLSVMGGCTGSTAGGFKVFRIQVIYSIAKNQIKQMLHPHGVFIATYQNRNISETIVSSVLTYFFLWGASLVILSLLLSLSGLTLPMSIYSSLAMLSNLGICFGDNLNITSNFAFCSEEAKWVMMIGMILGRLEFVTLFVLIAPGFWRD